MLYMSKENGTNSEILTTLSQSSFACNYKLSLFKILDKGFHFQTNIPINLNHDMSKIQSFDLC